MRSTNNISEAEAGTRQVALDMDIIGDSDVEGGWPVMCGI